MIDSRKLARIRRRVVGSYLSEKGYAVSDKEYFAKVGHQLRYVRFSAAKYGKAFDVNLALHFDFLPPFEFAVWPGLLLRVDAVLMQASEKPSQQQT